MDVGRSFLEKLDFRHWVSFVDMTMRNASIRLRSALDMGGRPKPNQHVAAVAANAPRGLGQGSENVMVIPAVVIEGPEVVKQIVEGISSDDPIGSPLQKYGILKGLVP